MNNINENTIIAIMEAIEDGVLRDEIIQKFPEQKEVIIELFETKDILRETATNIPPLVTRSFEPRLSMTRGSVESPYIIKSLLLSMNYKIVLPVLVLGVIAVGGGVFLSKEDTNVAQIPDETTIVQTEDNSSVPASQEPKEQSGRAKIASNESIDDILAGFSSDASNEQSVANEDGINADMFVQTELLALETENYDF